MTRARDASAQAHLEPVDLKQLTELFRAEAGLLFTDSAAVLERRLRERLAALGLATFGEYVDYLRNENGRREFDEALELVTTHETYFFREEYQLNAFRDEVLPRLKAAAGARRALSFWSAGCSTGEEAYTIAMVAATASATDKDRWDIRVFGSDLSRRCIAVARRGVYTAGSFRVVPREYRAAYFLESADGTYVVPEVRAMCSFAQMNLLDDARAAFVGRVDAIFCRNVLIYLDSAARQRVLKTLYDRLAPGGYLMLGHSESLLNVPNPFEPVRFGDDLVYRRPEGEAPLSGLKPRSES